MPTILGSEGSYIMIGRGPVFQGGAPTTQAHIPINPILNFKSALVEYIQKQIVTCNVLFHNIEFDEKLEAGDCTLSTYYRDPFIMLLLLWYKGITGAWSGTGDVITGTFANKDNRDENIWLQMLLPDQSGHAKHIAAFYDGGQAIGYRWIINQQDGVKEEIDFFFTTVVLAENPVAIADALDDESFNQTGVKEVSTVIAKAATGITTNKYFTFEVLSDPAAAVIRTGYYVWFNKDAGGVAPAPSGYTAIEITVTTGDSAQVISDAITAGITAKDNVTAVNGGGTTTTTTITNTYKGDVEDAVDVDSTLTIAVTTQGVMELDGGWSNWDDEYESDDVVMAKDVTIIWGGVAIDGLEIQNGTLEIITPKEYINVQSQLHVKDWVAKPRDPYKFEVSGILTNNGNISEAIAALSTKTKGTLKISYGVTNIGYFQFTNAYLRSDAIGDLPEAGEARSITFTFFAGADSEFTTHWTGNVTKDPSALINHTDI